MSEFKRGLEDKLINCVKNETSWWREVVEHPNLAIAVRHKYLNVYANGQSIFKISQKSGTLVAETHYKYLVDRAAPVYRSFSREPNTNCWKFKTEGLQFIREYEKRSTLEQLIRNAKIYAGDEKKHVHSILKRNSNVIDVEVAFTTLLEGDAQKEPEEDAQKSRVDRIDIVALEEGSGGSIWIVFYEVKTFKDPRIRAKESAEVLSTLKDYREAIERAEGHIKIAYRQVCRDLMALQRPVGKPGKLDPLIEKATSVDVLNVDPNPRLVIVGYDDPQWKDARWKDQLKKLEDLACRVISKGDGADIELDRKRPIR